MADNGVRVDTVYGMDLELSCWDGPIPEGEQREIISIGIAELRLREGVLTRRQTFLVRPACSSISPFCTALTGLTEAALRKGGRSLREVLGSITKLWSPRRRLTVCWGDDVPSLHSFAARSGAESPFGPALDLAQLLHVLDGASQRRSLEAVMVARGLVPEQPAHEASVDAANTLRLFAQALPISSSRISSSNSGAPPVTGAGPV